MIRLFIVSFILGLFSFSLAQNTIEEATMSQLSSALGGSEVSCPPEMEAPGWTFKCSLIEADDTEGKQVVDLWAEYNYWAAQTEWLITSDFWVRDFTYLDDVGLNTARVLVSGKYHIFVFSYQPFGN